MIYAKVKYIGFQRSVLMVELWVVRGMLYGAGVVLVGCSAV
jgi:hypothetical protein